MNFFNENGSWDWNREDYMVPFCFVEKAETKSEHVSSYFSATASSKVKAVATINGNLLKAMQRVFMLEHGYEIGGIAETNRGPIAEIYDLSGEQLQKIFAGEDVTMETEMFRVLLNKKNGTWMTARYDASGKSLGVYSNDESPVPYWMLVIIEAVDNDPSAEATNLWDRYIVLQKKALKEGIAVNEKKELLDVVAQFCDNIYRRVVYPDVADSKFKDGAIRLPNPDNKSIFPAGLLSSLTIMDGFGKINGKPVTCPAAKAPVAEEVTEDAEETEGEKEVPSNITELKGFYDPNPERILDEDEKALIPDIPQSYDISRELVRVCSLIKKSTALPTAKRNFIFIGGAGSGKSEAAKMVAYALGRPMLHLATDPDTDKMDLANSCIPDGKGGFVWVESPLMEALEKGYVCEITEADLIVKSGTLGYLNPLFDKTASFQLNTGRVIRRHPDAVVIYTINGTYEGCRNMNQAVKDRCKIIPFATPDDETLLHRVKTESGLQDEETIRKMIDVLHRVEDHCNTNYITDGTCGVRSLIDWAGDVACGEDPWDSAFSSIVWKWTFDENEHAALMRCVETQFERGSLWEG